MLPIQKNINLKPFNTLGVEAKAKSYVSLNSLQQLKQLYTQNCFKDLFYVLGGGSNVLFTQDYSSLIIHNQLKGIQILTETDAHIFIKVAAGEIWHEFVLNCIKRGFGGLENLSLIPGTVGAAPIQNIGAYGVELKDQFESLDAFSVETGEIITFSKNECQFGYRNSIFKNLQPNTYIITSVTFKLNKFPILNFSYGLIKETLHKMDFRKLSIKVISDAVIKIRDSKLPDPKLLPNAGSFFKNPIIPISQYQTLLKDFPTMPSYPTEDNYCIKISAGWLIEQVGLKGKRLGNVGIHDKQALVLINHNNGTAQEILALVDMIQIAVKKKFNIELEPEVRMV